MTAPGQRVARRSRRARRGFTLVEVLVAIGVFGINAAAMLATVTLIASLVRAASMILVGVGEGEAIEVCGAMALVTIRAHGASGPSRRARFGLTLVELLIAIALTSVVLGLLGFLTQSVTRARATFDERADEALVEHGLRIAVEGEIARAGSGMREDECGLDIDAGGSELDAWRRGDDGVELRTTYSAGADAEGRLALYRRVHPYPRQPWIEDVSAFRVDGFERTAAARVVHVDVVLEHGATGRTLAWRVPLLHLPCLRGSGG